MRRSMRMLPRKPFAAAQIGLRTVQPRASCAFSASPVQALHTAQVARASQDAIPSSSTANARQPVVPGVNPASRPHARHRPELPHPRSYRAPALLLILFSVLTWSAFTAHATNRERLSSSVLKSVVDKIRDSDRVRGVMGEDVGMKREMILGGDPWIRGSVSVCAARERAYDLKADLAHRQTGQHDAGSCGHLLQGQRVKR